MAVQSKEEILRVFDEWGRHYAPANLIQNEKNAALLADYVLKTYGVVSITYLTQAANALAAQLDLVQQPKPKTQEELTAEFQAKEFKRIQKEQVENSKPFDERVKEFEKKQNAEKDKIAQEAAAREIQSEIMRYECYSGPNRVDHTQSDAHRNQLLRQVERRRKAGVDERRILAEVRDAIQLLP